MMIINGNHESAEGAEQGPKITQIKEQCGEVKTWLLASELGPGCASLPRSSSLNKTLAGILMQKKKILTLCAREVEHLQHLSLAGQDHAGHWSQSSLH